MPGVGVRRYQRRFPGKVTFRPILKAGVGQVEVMNRKKGDRLNLSLPRTFPGFSTETLLYQDNSISSRETG